MAALAADASDMDRLKHWVDSVKNLPRFFRTREAGTLMDALANVGIISGADLANAVFEDIASRLGSPTEQLRITLGRCPFGI
jgi:hypothetical protein